MTLAEQVASLRRTLFRLLTRRLGERTDRSLMQLVALNAIAVEEIRSQAALADRLLLDAPAISRLVERLVEDGLVRRAAGEDRRCVGLEVTEAGQRELQVLRAESEWLEGVVRQHLTARELGELRRLLDKLQAGLTQGQTPTSSRG